jgi:ubiquinone/menaquinone biosynthesis C-methylase UbiE
MTEVVKNWTQWLKTSRFGYMSEEQKQQTLNFLFQVRDKVLDRAKLKADDVLIDIGTGTGLLAFGAYERLKSLGGTGKSIASDAFMDCVEECYKIAKECSIENEMGFLQADASNTQLPENSVDVVVMRSVLVHIVDKAKAVNEFYRILNTGGRVSLFEPVISENTKYFELMTPEKYSNYEALKASELKMTSDEKDPLMNFTQDSLKKDFENAGFKNIDVDIVNQVSTYVVSKEMIEPWFNTPPSPGSLTVKEKYLKDFSEEEVNKFIEILKQDLDGREITITSPTIYLFAEKI